MLVDEQNWRRSEATAGSYYVGLEISDDLDLIDYRISEYLNNAVAASYPNVNQAWTRVANWRRGVPERTYYWLTDTGGTLTTVALPAGSSLWVEFNRGGFAFNANAIPATALDLADDAKKAAARALLNADQAHGTTQITFGYGGETRTAADTSETITVPVGGRFIVRGARAGRGDYRFVTLPAAHTLPSVIGEGGEDYRRLDARRADVVFGSAWR